MTLFSGPCLFFARFKIHTLISLTFAYTCDAIAFVWFF